MVQKPAKGKVGTCRERNCNCYDGSSIAEKKETTIATTAPVLQTARKLQSPRPLHYCEERGTAITTTVPVLQRERNCNCYNRSCIAEKETVIIATLPWLQTTFRKQTFQAAYDPFEFCRICSFSSIQNPGRCPDSEGAAGLNWACVVFPAVNSPIPWGSAKGHCQGLCFFLLVNSVGICPAMI